MFSRRTFLGAGLAGPPAFLLGGCVASEGPPPDPNRSRAQDVELLNSLLELELGAAAAYRRLAELLDGDDRETAELFERQERKHADALTAAIDDLGATPVEPRSERRYERDLRLDELERREDVLLFAADLANNAIGAYNDAVPRISVPSVRRTLYTIVAVEAEHLSVVLGALGEAQVPDAFAVGAQV